MNKTLNKVKILIYSIIGLRLDISYIELTLIYIKEYLLNGLKQIENAPIADFNYSNFSSNSKMQQKSKLFTTNT